MLMVRDDCDVDGMMLLSWLRLLFTHLKQLNGVAGHDDDLRRLHDHAFGPPPDGLRRIRAGYDDNLGSTLAKPGRLKAAATDGRRG